VDRESYLKSQAKYNASYKGRERNRKYEASHPDRKDRSWSKIMEVKHRSGVTELDFRKW
jgi:hypothetical protein